MQPVDQPQHDNDEQENTDNGQLKGVFENDFSYYCMVQLIIIIWIICQKQNWKLRLQFYRTSNFLIFNSEV